jgi:hypothetical protein
MGEEVSCKPGIVAGADPYLPYWDERPFLPSSESVIAAAKEMLD